MGEEFGAVTSVFTKKIGLGNYMSPSIVIFNLPKMGSFGLCGFRKAAGFK